MIVQLSVPYRDARAADLVWTLDGADETALHTRIHRVGLLDVEVRILGASHQVAVRLGGDLLCRETVSCREGAAGVLPSADGRALGFGFGYEVRCDVRALPCGELSEWVKTLRSSVGGGPAAVIAFFPPGPDALTAVAVEPLPAGPAGVLWRTWHTYPHPGGSGEVVATRTVVYRPTPL